MPVQYYRDGPIEDTAVRYVRINREVEQKATSQEQTTRGIIRAAELDFKLDLETLIKEMAPDPDLIELSCCLQDNNSNQIPQDYRTVAKRLIH